MANPEMDVGVKIGMGVFVLILVGVLVLYHAWITPSPDDAHGAPPRDDVAQTTVEPDVRR